MSDIDNTGTWQLWGLAELEALPTLGVGQTDNLKVETEVNDVYVRVWLARTGVEDGEPYDNRISVETCNADTGQWRVIHEYPGE